LHCWNELLLGPAKSGIQNDRHHPVSVDDIRDCAIEADTRCARKRIAIPTEYVLLALDEFGQAFELGETESRLKARHSVFEPYLLIAKHRVARCSSMIAQAQAAIVQPLIVIKQHAAFTCGQCF